ncbi:ATP-dependent helicase DinG, partial [human gut metagenome]
WQVPAFAVFPALPGVPAGAQHIAAVLLPAWGQPFCGGVCRLPARCAALWAWGFGRAIRTEADTCVIAILDERASHGRRYYAAMRDALPDMRTTSSLRAVTKFLRELKPESYFEVDA